MFRVLIGAGILKTILNRCYSKSTFVSVCILLSKSSKIVPKKSKKGYADATTMALGNHTRCCDSLISLSLLIVSRNAVLWESWTNPEVKRSRVVAP